MKFYTLRELHLPHPRSAWGVIVGNDDRRFLVLFIDQCGEVVGMFVYQSDDMHPWHDFKQQYIAICRRLSRKPWKHPNNIETLYRYLCDVM